MFITLPLITKMRDLEFVIEGSLQVKGSSDFNLTQLHKEKQRKISIEWSGVIDEEHLSHHSKKIDVPDAKYKYILFTINSWYQYFDPEPGEHQSHNTDILNLQKLLQ